MSTDLCVGAVTNIMLVGDRVSMFNCVEFLLLHGCRLLQTIANETEHIMLELDLTDVESVKLNEWYEPVEVEERHARNV